LKALSMIGFGLVILASALWRVRDGKTAAAFKMGAIGPLALVAGLAVAWLLYAFREGDANMRCVWLCTRNGASSNLAVMLAALGVYGSRRAWPCRRAGGSAGRRARRSRGSRPRQPRMAERQAHPDLVTLRWR
jgi:hypothetical protein